MENQKYLVQFWGGLNNGAARYYNKISTAKAQATKYVNKCYKEGGLPTGDCYAEIYYIQRKPNFKMILVQSIG